MSGDRTGEGPIEKCKGPGMPGAGVTGNMNRERWAVAAQWQSGSGLCRTEGLGGSVNFLPWFCVPVREQGFGHSERIWIVTGKRKGCAQTAWSEKRR